MKTKISNHIFLGLSYFFLNDFDQTFEPIPRTLNISKVLSTSCCFIAKVLYDVGESDTKIALQELTEYIATSSTDLLVTLTITAMSILDDKREGLSIILRRIESFAIVSK
ncbi:AFH_G0023410.mRNA.1.CDS.1 [Saccharomyces cerevisiae]|nr:AFH_G0023410.mRNA.1.CDS.1 [Saccharomyces cerevisiae]CAI6727101.1 AFH_G0023410.mRNA.1.CDS.1 [Saccharomyces cerevisiae]